MLSALHKDLAELIVTRKYGIYICKCDYYRKKHQYDYIEFLFEEHAHDGLPVRIPRSGDLFGIEIVMIDS